MKCEIFSYSNSTQTLSDGFVFVISTFRGYLCGFVELLNALLTFLHVPDDESIAEPLGVCSGAVHAKISCSTVPCYVTEDNKLS